MQPNTIADEPSALLNYIGICGKSNLKRGISEHDVFEFVHIEF